MTAPALRPWVTLHPCRYRCSLELLVDGETAVAEGTQVVLEIWASHFLRRDKFKVGCGSALLSVHVLRWPHTPVWLAGWLGDQQGSCALLPCPPAPKQGRAVVPLREVQRRRRLRGSWPLEGAPPGATLTMELSWTAAVGMH